ncbi:MAG: GDP-mannose 4,6-dehydratase, partial [Candidatus Binatia bacterium]
TGGAGFVGSHLAERLLAGGETVAVIDDLSTGAIDNVAHLKGRPNFRYVIGSVREKSVLAELIDDADVVVHLAAAVGVRLIVESPVRTIETNVRGTELVLDLANKKKKRVLIASTSEVYGKSSKVPFTEEDDLLLGPSTKGRWSYACSKALDEYLAIAYWREKKLPVTIVRLFNTVGPRQTGRYGMVIPSFVRQALMNQSISVFGSGEQSRCFCHVHDVVWAIEHLVRRTDTVGEVFNVGSDEEITINALAALVREMVASRSEIVHVPYAEAYEQGFEDMHRRVPSLAKVKAAIGYSPRHRIREILGDVIEYARNGSHGGRT